MCASEWKNKWRKTIKKWGKLCVFSQNSLHNKDNINVTCVNTEVLVFVLILCSQELVKS